MARVLRGILVALKAGGAEEDNRVLNLLAAKAGQRFLVLGKDAKDAPIRAVQESGILVGTGADLRGPVIKELAIKKCWYRA